MKAMIGYVPDFFGVYDNLMVWEYMEFFASCYHLDGLMARKRYTALLEQVGAGGQAGVLCGRAFPRNEAASLPGKGTDP